MQNSEESAKSAIQQFEHSIRSVQRFNEDLVTKPNR